jgi:hypothetical protein
LGRSTGIHNLLINMRSLFVSFLIFQQVFSETYISICGNEPIPSGWVTLNIYSQGMSTTCRTLVQYTNRDPGSTLKICGDQAPSGWVYTGWDSLRCAMVGYTEYYGKTIMKSDGLPAGSTIKICGDRAPSGWVYTGWDSLRCAMVGYTDTSKKFHEFYTKIARIFCALFFLTITRKMHDKCTKNAPADPSEISH